MTSVYLRATLSKTSGCLAIGGLLWCSLFLAPISALGQATPYFKPQRVLAQPMPPITHPTTISAAQANRMLGEAELVLGVSVGGEARAYPINMLTGPSREIINDRLGGGDIAATW